MKTRAAYDTNHSIYILCEQTIRDKPFQIKERLSYKPVKQPSSV